MNMRKMNSQRKSSNILRLQRYHQEILSIKKIKRKEVKLSIMKKMRIIKFKLMYSMENNQFYLRLQVLKKIKLKQRARNE